MRTFFAMLRTALHQALQYRTAAFAGVVCQFVFGLIYCMVYQAFFETGISAQPDMSLAQVISYTWLAQALFRALPWSGDSKIDQMMRTGDIAFELVRPVSLFKMWFARCMALRIAPLLLNALPMVLLAMLLPPAFALRFSPAMLPLGLVALCFAVLLSTAMTLLLTSSYFVTLSGYGINRLVPALALFCAGMMLPLTFLPQPIAMVLRLMPFAGMLDAPLRILVGAVDVPTALFLIALQGMWLVVLMVAGQCAMRAGVRHAMVQGG